MKKITIVSIPVSNQEVSKEFYLKVGFEVIVEAPMGDGNTWVQLGFPGTEASISLVNWFKNMTPGTSQGLVIATDNIEQEVKELTDKGIVVDKIDDTPWGRFASVNDPDGNGFTLHQQGNRF